MKYLESSVSQGSDSHVGVIRSLSFNTSGSLIASGSDDHCVKIWETQEMKLLYHIEGHSSVLSIAWTADPNILVAGFEDGVVVTIIITKTLLQTYSVCIRETQRRPDFPVECLSLNARSHPENSKAVRLATGGQQRVRVWNQLEGTLYQWSMGHEVADPFVNGINDTKVILVTGLEWLNETSLIVSYMYHGLIIWDSVRKRTVNAIPVPSPIGRMALSPDGLSVAVSNFRDGVDIWDRLKNGLKQGCKGTVTGRKYPLPVIFLHGGAAVASGNMEGNVSIWNAKSGMIKDELKHHGKSIHALASYGFHDRLKKEDKFIVATAASTLDQHQIYIWKASSNSAIFLRPNQQLRKYAVSQGGSSNCLACTVTIAVGLPILAIILGTK